MLHERLGDKDNHLASLHLAQMLYIWPFISFFSLPMLWPWVLNGILPRRLVPRRLQYNGNIPGAMFTAVNLGIAAVMIGIARYNTVVHPFTLADNRHYMFYVFRILLRHPSIKYIAVPIYVHCGWSAILALGHLDDMNLQIGQDSSKSPQIGNALVPGIAQGTNVTFVLIWLLATALCLVTAPLVEPRYSILSWFFWRLQLARPRPISNSRTEKNGQHKSANLSSGTRYDNRLWLETIWFVLINCATGYIFLYRGFEWPQEPGKIQRFMW